MTQQNRVCQSCGMPLVSPADYGTESDGIPSTIYCKHCYQQGKFTEPDINQDQMTERCAGMLSKMYEMPLDKATLLTGCQIQNLYRWSGRMIPVCESCGMPLNSDQDAGTEKDGTPSTRYCKYCYLKGGFTDPELTREGMIKKYATMLSSQFEVPVGKAEEMITVFSKTLPRWRE